MIDHNAAGHFVCSNRHYLRYFTTPLICPRSGCGSRDIVPADPTEAQRALEREKTDARATTAPFH